MNNSESPRFQNSAANVIATTLRWVARIGSVASISLLLLFMFGGQERPPTLAEMSGMIFFPFGVMLGMALGWFRELAGGLLTLFSLVGFYAWHFVVDGGWAEGPYFALFALPGLLYLVAWSWSHRRQASGSGRSATSPG